MAHHNQGAAEIARRPLRGRVRTLPDPFIKVPRLAPVYLRSLLREAARVGAEVAPLFRGLGFSAKDLDSPDFRVSQAEAITVTRRALRLLDNPRLGLDLGMRSCLTHRGALALGLLASPTLLSSFDLMLAFPHSAGFLLHVRDVRSADGYKLVAEPVASSHDLATFLVDKLFAGLVHQCRQICDDNCSPALVELMRPPPENAQAHEQHYRAKVRFNASANRLSYDACWLGQRLPMADAMSHRLALDLLERETAQWREQSTLSLAVGRLIRSLHPQTPTLAQVASQLHVSERSLRRKLAEEGMSFRLLLDDHRKARALDLLSNGRRSLADVAAEAGFGDARSLRRALNRWTDADEWPPGVSPNPAPA